MFVTTGCIGLVLTYLMGNGKICSQMTETGPVLHALLKSWLMGHWMLGS